jgi:protein MpaA
MSGQIVRGVWGPGRFVAAIMAARPAIVLGVAMAGGLAGCEGAGAKRSDPVQAAGPVRGVWEEVGVSVKGRPIEAITVGTGATRVLVIGGVHGDEREAHPSISRLVERLGAGDAAAAATWRVVRDLNPDGSALARRANANQVDLNRNFPARNYVRRTRHGPRPLSEPETSALYDMVLSERPSLIVVFHSSGYGPFVNYDGPGAEAARAFADGASQSDRRWRLVPEMSYATPGSLGSYFGVDQGVPVLTIEFERGQEPLQAWLALEAGFQGLTRHIESSAGARAEGSE